MCHQGPDTASKNSLANNISLVTWLCQRRILLKLFIMISMARYLSCKRRCVWDCFGKCSTAIQYKSSWNVVHILGRAIQWQDLLCNLRSALFSKTASSYSRTLCFLEQVILNLGKIILKNVSRIHGISKHNFMHFWAGDQLWWKKLVPLVF